jgi:hypothetical protein
LEALRRRDWPFTDAGATDVEVRFAGASAVAVAVADFLGAEPFFLVVDDFFAVAFLPAAEFFLGFAAFSFFFVAICLAIPLAGNPIAAYRMVRTDRLYISIMMDFDVLRGER